MNEKKRVMGYELREMNDKLRVIRNKPRDKNYSFLVSHFSLLLMTICLVLPACSALSPAATDTPTPTPTFTPLPPTSTPSPSETSTATATATATPAETATASSEWQTSADGHIMFIEKDLFNGLFTLNQENNGEYTKEYWELIIRGLWNLNSISKNTAFLTQFPTDQSLVDYLNNGGRFVDNLWIPVQYPNTERQYWSAAVMTPLEGSVDLSQIGIAIYKPTPEEMKNYREVYSPNKRFMSINGMFGSVAIDVNNKILTFTLRRDLLKDYRAVLYDNNVGIFLALSDEKTPEENLKAATQLLEMLAIQMQTRDTNGYHAWVDIWNPPGIKFWPILLSASLLDEAASLEGTPLAIR